MFHIESIHSSTGRSPQFESQHMAQVGTRKRPAPGASPMQSPQSQNFAAINLNGGNTTTTTTMTDHYPHWPQQGAISYADSSSNFEPSPYNGTNGQPAAQSNQLARRTLGQQIVPRNTYNDAIMQENSAQPSAEQWVAENDDLERRAEVAKRETQAKRKQIPPFVQKLSR